MKSSTELEAIVGRVFAAINDRDAATGEWQFDLFANEVSIPWIVGVDRDGGVAEHRFRSRGGNDDVRLAAGFARFFLLADKGGPVRIGIYVVGAAALVLIAAGLAQAGREKKA